MAIARVTGTDDGDANDGEVDPLSLVSGTTMDRAGWDVVLMAAHAASA